jgi:hypothetical protein
MRTLALLLVLLAGCGSMEGSSCTAQDNVSPPVQIKGGYCDCDRTGAATFVWSCYPYPGQKLQ